MRLLIVCTSLCVVAFSSVTNFEDPARASQPSFATDTKDQSRLASPDGELIMLSRFAIPDGPRTPSRDVFELAFASFPMGNIEGKDASRFPPSRLNQPASFDFNATTDEDVDGQSAAAAGPDAASDEGAAPERRATMCETLANAAQKNDLPIGFLIRLIWQESRFNPNAVSRVGAQGMAQFMPRVAADVGLEDPFDPLQALPASARLLGTLHRQFGNLGLAAAAYNAGARRIHDWLTRRGKLPGETRNYVMNITGTAPERWKSAAMQRIDLRVPSKAPCREFVVAEVPLPLPAPTEKEKVEARAEAVAASTKERTASLTIKTTGQHAARIKFAARVSSQKVARVTPVATKAPAVKLAANKAAPNGRVKLVQLAEAGHIRR
jgi:hypothetical protein